MTVSPSVISAGAAQVGVAATIKITVIRARIALPSRWFSFSGRLVTGHCVEHGFYVVWYRVASPGDVSIRPHQNEIAPIQLARLRQRDPEKFQRHAALFGHANHRSAVGRAAVQPQQRESAPEVIV